MASTAEASRADHLLCPSARGANRPAVGAQRQLSSKNTSPEKDEEKKGDDQQDSRIGAPITPIAIKFGETWHLHPVKKWASPHTAIPHLRKGVQRERYRIAATCSKETTGLH
jgi:hypothetical protein